MPRFLRRSGARYRRCSRRHRAASMVDSWPALSAGCFALAHGVVTSVYRFAEVVGGIVCAEAIRLIPPAIPSWPALAREQLQIGPGHQALDALVYAVRLSGVLAAFVDHYLPNIGG